MAAMNGRSGIDFEAEGLLDGLEGSEREARLGLLRELEADGVGLEELQEAVQQNRLALLPVERVLSGEGPTYTPRQISELSGVELDLLQDLFRAMGLPRVDPDEPGLDEHDLAVGAAASDLPRGGDRRSGHRRHVAGDGDGDGEHRRGHPRGPRPDPDPARATTSRPWRCASRCRRASSARRSGSVLQYVLNRQLRDQIRRDVMAAGGGFGPDSGGTEICVCFADLVGFTKLGERLPGEELGRVAGRLAELASEAAESPVRLIKLIGDAAMLVSPDAVSLLGAALGLVEAAEAEGEGFPQVRVGAAAGEAIGRGGDWYGRPVNLASRITDIAFPGSVLASESATEMAGDEFAYSFAGERRLKGIDARVRLFRVRRRGEE